MKILFTIMVLFYILFCMNKLNVFYKFIFFIYKLQKKKCKGIS